MVPAVLRPRRGVPDALAHHVGQRRSDSLQPHRVPGQAADVQVVHGRGQAAEQIGPDDLGRGVGDVDEHLAVADLNGVRPDVLPAVPADAGAELEFPVVPGVREHAVLHVSAHQGVTLVRASIVAGEDAAGRSEQRDSLVQVGE